MEEKTPIFDYGRSGTGLMAAGATGILSLAACLVGARFHPEHFAFSYFCAWTFFFTICAGSLFWTMVHHAAGAEWSVVARRQFENVACLFDALAILFVPLLFVAPRLWPSHHSPYLAPWFFWFRAAFYFVFFIGISLWLRRNSIRQDRDGCAARTTLNRRISLAGLPLFALCITFLAIDWLMGLEFPWHSSIEGVYLFAGSALGALCVVTLAMSGLRNAGYFRGVFTVEHEHILGKLLFAFTSFWAYVAFSQYLLIWNANIPEETSYYILRTTGNWRTACVFLAIGHFLVPFLVLLPAWSKRNGVVLCGIAGWILLMHAVDVYLMIMPVLDRRGIALGWFDMASFVAIGSLLVVVYFKRLGDSALWPTGDPNLARSLKLKN